MTRDRSVALPVPVALGGAAIWGAAEASLYFLVPDVWIGLVALRDPRRAMPAVASAVIGALVGAAALYGAGRTHGGRIDAAISRLPGIRSRDPGDVRRTLADRGLRAFLDAPLRTLPVKLYVREAQRAGTPCASVLVATAGNRLVRLVPVGTAFALLGHRRRRFIARHSRVVTLVYAVGWAVFYRQYWRSRR